MPTSKEAWERVLAAIEADARRAEALLVDHGGRHGDTALADPVAQLPAAGIPVDWILPGGTHSELPPLEEMPPVPQELRERIVDLRTRIDALQTELAAAMRELRRPRPQLTPATVRAVPASPHFVDTRL